MKGTSLLSHASYKIRLKQCYFLAGELIRTSERMKDLQMILTIPSSLSVSVSISSSLKSCNFGLMFNHFFMTIDGQKDFSVQKKEEKESENKYGKNHVN
jgi:hypothetical protein